MAITAAEYTDINETSVKISFDVGDDLFATDDYVPLVEWVDLGNTITAFLDVPGRLTEAKEIASDRLRLAYAEAKLTITASAGGFNFRMTPDTLHYLAMNLLVTPPAVMDFITETDTVESLSISEQRDLAADVRAIGETFVTDWDTDYTAIQVSLTVAEIDTALINSNFGNLGPVYT